MLSCFYVFANDSTGSFIMSAASTVHVGNQLIFTDFRALLSARNQELFDQLEPPMKMLCIHTRYGGIGYNSPDDVVEAVIKGRVKLKIASYTEG